MKRLTAIVLALMMLLSYAPTGIFETVAKAESEVLTFKPTDDTWSGYSTSYRNVIQGVEIEEEESNIHDRLFSIGASSNGDLSTKIYNSALVYMKYDLADCADVKIKSAKLKLYGKSFTSTAVNNMKLNFFKVDNNWAENTLIYGKTPIDPLKDGVPNIDLIASNDPDRIQPDFVSQPFNMCSTDDGFELKEFDVTELIKQYNLMEDSTVSFAYIVYPTAHVFQVVSKDAEETDMHPVLEITTEPIPEMEAVSGPSGDVEFDSSVSVKFSNNIDASTVSASSVSLFKDGDEIEVYDEDIAVEDDELIISTPFSGYCNYDLVLSTDIKDIYGNNLIDETSFSFFTVGVHTENTYTHNEGLSGAEPDILEASLLLTTAPDATRSTATGKTPIMGGGKNHHVYYVEIDLSTIDTSVPFASFIYKLKFSIGKSGQVFNVIEINEDYDTETVTYNEIIDSVNSGKVISAHPIGIRNAEYYDFDITEFVNGKLSELPDNDKVVRFAIRSTVTATTNFYTNFSSNLSNRPKAVIVFDDDSFTGVKSADPAHGATDVSVDSQLKMTFSVPMDNVTYENFSLTKLGDSSKVILSSDDVVYDESTKTVTITPPGGLDELTTYELSAFGATSLEGNLMHTKKIKFVTGSRLSVGEITVTGGDDIDEGSVISACVNLENTTASQAKSPELILAIFSGDNPVRFSKAGVDSIDAYETATLETSLAVTADENGYKDYFAKAFLWDSTDSMLALCEPAIGGSDASGALEGKFFGIHTLEGSFSNSSEAQITAIVENFEGEICWLGQMTGGMDGEYSFNVSLHESGDYIAYVMSRGSFGEKMQIAVDDYVSYEDYLSVWEDINSENKTRISSVITKAVDIFDFDEINYSIDHVTDKIASDIKEYGDFGSYGEENISDFYEFLKESAYEHYLVADLLAQIADASNHSELTGILDNEENAEYLGIDDSLSKYRKNSKKVNKALVGKEFEDVEDFEEAFNKALKDAEDDHKDPGSGGGGSSVSFGGSGSGSIYMGGEAPILPSEPVQPQNPSSSSSELVQTEENYFLDLSAVPWAEKEIEFLYRMGVINGRGERAYAPNENVLREEFVKLIVEAVEVDKATATSSFEDVSKDSWCYPYVSAAFENKIVNGVSDTKFGAGTPITRQDICVMTARTLELAGFSAKPEKEMTFTDASAIDDYAKEAVGYLNEIGIVTGMTDGHFNPKSYATRAETACIIYRTLDFIKANGSTLWKTEAAHGSENENTGDFVFNSPTTEQIQADIENVLMKKSHPYIHATRETLDSIKASLVAGDDEFIAKEYAQTKETADEYLKTKPAVKTAVSQSFSNVQPLIVSCMTVYYIEGGEEYLNRCLAEFENFKNIEVWYTSSQLNTTMTMMSIAICYDWLYDYLTEEQKAWAVDAIKTHGLEMSRKYYETPTALKSIRAEYNNINIQCGYNSFNHAVFNNSHNVIAALAIAPEMPEYSAYIISNALHNLECYLELVKDGGFEESSTYYGYCTGRYVFAVSALKSSLETLYGYEKSPGFKNTAWWGLYMFGPMVFGDCVPTKSPFNTDSLYILAKESKNDAMMKRIIDLDQNSSIWPLLWYEKGDHDHLGDYPVPLDHIFRVPDQHIFVMRNHPDDKYNTFIGMYAGSGNATGHSDAVSGLFHIEAFGERYAMAMGYGDYDLEGYFDNHQTGKRWNYYERRTEAGNCLVINPSLDVGQDVTTTATIIDHQSSNGAAFAIADLQPVYHREVKSYKRGLKIHNNRSQIVVQDEAVMKKPSEIFWSFNTPAQLEIVDRSTAILSHGDKKVAVKIYANVPYELYEMPAEKLPTSPVVDTQRDWKEFRKLAIKAKGVEELKLMVEFTPYVSDLQMPESISQWIDLDSWTATEKGADVPKLNSISFNGTPIEGFDPENYFYEVDAGNLEKQPQITAEAMEGYSYEVIYPEKLPGAVDIAVGDEEGEVVSYYRVRVVGKGEAVDVTKYNKITVKKVTAPQHDGNVPENVIDGLLTTRWSASSEKGDTYLDFDLGSEYNLKAINIAIHSGDTRNAYFEVHTSVDGKKWDKNIVFGRSSGTTTDFEPYALEATGVRYVRFVGQDNSANHWNSVSEIEIYGE
ncbi:MAG: S-layer homology domain-containing protein [Clostridia bacterium]|nr:S-layer homology domain-containing protein [Clostridia bacterium]